MPSCSSKLSVLRDNEFRDTINNFICIRKAILQLFLGVAPDQYIKCFTETLLKIPWWFFKRNIILISNNWFWKSCWVLNNFTLDAPNLTKYIYRDSEWKTTFFQCEDIKLANCFYQAYILNVLYNHNAICFIIFYFALRVSPFVKLLRKLKFQKCVKKKLDLLYYKVSWVSYGNNYNSVMEVDDPGKKVNSLEIKLPNGELPNVNLSKPSIEKDRPDGVCLTVINDNQIMKESEYPQISKSVTNENSIEVIVKKETAEDNLSESLLNGNVDNNIHSNQNDITSQKLNEIVQLSETNRELNTLPETDKVKICKNEIIESSIKSELKNISTNGITIQEVKSEENLKTESVVNESNSEKEKDTHKDHNSASASVNNVLSPVSAPLVQSTSTKKHSSQSHQSSSSSTSSSSSRHKYKDYKNGKTISSSSLPSKNDEKSSSSHKDHKSKSDSRSKSRNCHHKPEEKCHCKSRHRSRHHSKKSKKFQSVKTQCTADEIAYEYKRIGNERINSYFTRIPWVPHPQLANLKYGKYYRIEEDRNGGATVCHLFMDEICHLSENQMKECAIEFIKLSYSEDENDCAYHVMGIVHGAASYLPDLVDYMADHYPNLTVKTGSLASRDNHTTTMSQYRDEVYKTYSNGTFRYAPLDQLSICGVLGEEVGAYFPDFVARLEQSPFMKPVMPWSFLSVVQTDNPRESNDGPIFWVRPGEQMLPANEALKESARPKKRRNNELDNLAYIGGSRFSEARESLFMDRTKAHADQVGVDYGISNTAPTAAVGVLKAVNCGHPEHGNRATKDVVAFHAQDYNELLEILMLDLYEPPQTQCTKWIEISKLNTLRREGIRYAHLQLHDNDVYYLPRKIIHQFQTISSVASVAWHIRYRDYFSLLGAPNLHTPTGINKGQVFYEKKNVAVYCPPVRENDFLSAVTNLDAGLKTPKKSDRLKEYSPFKHSPRKMHKYQSPRSASKKEKPSESVPLSSNNAVIKEAEAIVDANEKKSNSSSNSKKRERSKSTDDTKGEQEEDLLRTSEKSESSHNRRLSNEHNSSKKEKNRESHPNHRHEVKNLDFKFNVKKGKSKQDKNKHKNDDSKHNKSSKESRHDKPSKSGSSRHDKEENKFKEKSGSSSSNGHNLHKTKTEEKKESLKRKHELSPSRTPVKKIKEENFCADVLENGKSPIIQSDNPSENPSTVLSDVAVNKKEDNFECKTAESEEKDVCKSVPQISETCKNEISASIPKINSTDSEPNSSKTASNGSLDNDLKHINSHNEFVSPISNLSPPLPPLPPPPPPPTGSPPVNPPLPPSSPPPPLTSSSDSVREKPTVDSHDSCSTVQTTHLNNVQDNCITPKDKMPTQVKKVKKKVVKKSSESYDLLGDIMSEMDKKKL